MDTKNKQYEAVCSKCDTSAVLENEEVENGEFICPECNQLNKFTILDIKEVILSDSESGEEPEINSETAQKKKKKLYIMGGIAVIIVGIIYFAYTSDAIKFINAKEKAAKHLKTGNEILANLTNNQNPDQNELQRALSEFNLTLEFDESNVEAIFSRSVIYASTGKINEAITDLDKAITINPSLGDAYFYRALCKVQLGQMQQAISDLDKTLELSPANINALFYRANTKFEIKDFKGAKDDMSLVIAGDSTFANGFAFRGLCEVFLGDKLNGCNDLKKAKTLGFPKADSLINLYCK